MHVDWFSRLTMLLAGLLGASGVAAAAASAHLGGALLPPLALVALTQAPAMLALGLLSPVAVALRIGALGIGVGALLFVGDLAVRQFWGQSVFAYAAPAGGIAMMAGWAIVAFLGVLLGSRRL